ncbi:hypothetical protein GCM10018785_72850 [Streptomyces longispororuber]|uniref:Uncharacterized protein n=1 Tax=Streptomyces longispororuber TaxID=68230 RepID=A0A919AEB8_9ACTN|nr:hypothetical protein [Streptomyces longispororuber]GHE97970.1 hypothetical protein GCM10018785_72850 [Streptomyces longispororuber]
MDLTINLVLLLVVVVVLRLRGKSLRGLADERLTVLFLLVLAVLLAPTGLGREVLDTLGDLVSGVLDALTP